MVISLRQRSLLLALIACAAWGCKDDQGPVEATIRVAVSTDAVVPDDIDGLQVVVTRGGVTMFSEIYDEAIVGQLPDTLLLHNGDARTDTGDFVYTPIEVIVHGRKGTTDVITRRAETTFVNTDPRLLRMRLCMACAGVTCDGGQTCVEGQCATANVDVESLPQDDGTGSLAGVECKTDS